MDKLGTYALVAALKEITRRTSPAQERSPGAQNRMQNERWISLRSMAQEMPLATLEPVAPPVPEASVAAPAPLSTRPVQAASNAPAQPLSTAPTQRNLENYRRIEMRHQAARRNTKE